MADGSNITPFPRTPLLRVAEQAPAGRHEFGERPIVDQDHGRVYLRGQIYKCFVSESNATRCAAALSVLADLDALPPPRSLRDALSESVAASVANIPTPPDVA